MSRHSWLLITAITLFTIGACDRRSSQKQVMVESIRCTVIGSCGQNTQFGMVGDSWTDFAGGVPILADLRDHLVDNYGFQLTTSNLAGLTLRFEWENRRGFEQVIHQAGPKLRFMLLSLGGNDLMSSSGDYSNHAQSTLDSRLASFDNQLRLLITDGDLLKQSLYGGPPLTWIIHSYDYPDPVLDPQCVSGYVAGSGDPTANDLPRFIEDGFNTKLQYLTTQIPNLRVIDARGTLGGPPSLDSLMFDCIHPNNNGFTQYSAAYVVRLDAITGGAR